MRVAELSERSGVPLPTIKFYIRENLLPAGRSTGKNQAEYGDEHLARLALIRSLRDDAGLSVAAIARALRAADDVVTDEAGEGLFIEAAVDSIGRYAGPTISERSEEYRTSKAELVGMLEARSWALTGEENALKDAARVLTVIKRAFEELDTCDLVPYAEAAELLAKHELPEEFEPLAARETALRYAVLGTVLFEPLILALRRLAHVSRTRTLSRARAEAASRPARPRSESKHGAKQGAATRAEASAGTAQIHRAVRAIPRGKVATYGQLAELVGLPNGHRMVAQALRTCPSDLPWQRVVGKKDARRAQIAIADPEHAGRQRKLLTAEGVRFDEGGFIALSQHGWLPTDTGKGGPRSRPKRTE